MIRGIFAAVSVVHGYYLDVVALGPVEAIESESLRGAPVGTLLIDDETDRRGRVHAERTFAGWLVTVPAERET